MSRPGHKNARKRLGNQETVPGLEHPCTLRQKVECPNRSPDTSSKLRRSRLGNHGRPTRPICSKSTVQPIVVRAFHVAKSRHSTARARPANSAEPKPGNCTRDQFAIKTLADQDGNAVLPKIPRTGQQRTMPEGVNTGRRRRSSDDALVGHVFITQRDTDAPDDKARHSRNDRKRKALSKRKGRHGD